MEINARVDAMTAGDQETITYTLEVKGSRLADVETPQPPEATGLALMHRIPNTTHRTSAANGKIFSTITFSWRFRPVRSGQARTEIGATTVVVGGRSYRTDPINVRVVPQAQRPQGSTGLSEQPDFDPRDLFLRAVPSKTSAYRGEQIVIDYFLYYRPGYRPHGIRLADAWDADGFWREDLEPDPNHRPSFTDVVNGVIYNRLLVKRVAVFPTRAGRLQIDSLRIHADVSLPHDGDPFGAMFRTFDRGTTVTLASRGVGIESRALPPAPTGFSGAVGKFAFSGAASPDEVNAGERVRLSLAIHGEGNLATLNAPPVEVPQGIEVFGPEMEQTITRNGDRLAGRKQFTYSLVPQRGGTFTIRPVSFTYFDPQSGAYRTLRTEPMTILAAGEVQTETARPAPLGQEVGVLMTGAAWRAAQRKPLYARPWPYLALGLPLVLLASLVLVRRRQEALQQDVARTRSKQALPLAQQHLAHAHELLREDDSRAFYAELDRALLAYLANKLNAPVSQTQASLDTLLRQHAIPEATIATLHALRERISLARFAPIFAQHDEMERDLALTSDLITTLDA